VFDFVILSQTIQATEKPRAVLEHLLRIGKHAAISLPNFGHWRVRLSLLAGGRMPRTRTLDYDWYDTPNIHLCTISDFVELASRVGATIESAIALDSEGRTKPTRPDAWGPNLLAKGAIFLMRKS
jgi:methionine biosynthesis protein MetW